ncbi:MAG TPA: hypothetical protein VHU85_05455 [Acidimicrobiales bacterium]|jgi:hypothetical protein|nr:hypothetical protein [Acidimicrobiales bacterium]
MGSEESSDPVPAPTGSRLVGSEALKLHLTLAGGLALCIAGFYFELDRALGGNSLSWAYVFEWPLFAAFAVYMWWNMLHHGTVRRRRPVALPRVAPEHVGMLKAWQEHQRTLAGAETEVAPGSTEVASTPRPQTSG